MPIEVIITACYPYYFVEALVCGLQEARINRMNHFYHLHLRFRELIFQLRKGLR